MSIPEMNALEAEIIEVLNEAQSGQLANWPTERLALVRFMVDNATAEQLARAFHYYLHGKLQASYAAKRAIFTMMMNGYDGRPQ